MLSNNETLDNFMYKDITAKRFEIGAVPVVIPEEIQNQIAQYLNFKQQSKKTYFATQNNADPVMVSSNYKA